MDGFLMENPTKMDDLRVPGYIWKAMESLISATNKGIPRCWSLSVAKTKEQYIGMVAGKKCQENMREPIFSSALAQQNTVREKPMLFLSISMVNWKGCPICS